MTIRETNSKKMEENRDENQKLLKQKKSLIIKQINAAKLKVPKYLDDNKKRLITEVESVQEKNEEKFINSISVCLLSCCTCGCCTFIDLYLIGQGRVICDRKPMKIKYCLPVVHLIVLL
jgi:hypothetical protein